MPFPECGAMSQGYIGYHLQNALGNELTRLHVDKTVASIVTQVIVDENDPAFQKPTKPIGSFYSKEECFQSFLPHLAPRQYECGKVNHPPPNYPQDHLNCK